jgi:hypothetical protein
MFFPPSRSETWYLPNPAVLFWHRSQQDPRKRIFPKSSPGDDKSTQEEFIFTEILLLSTPRISYLPNAVGTRDLVK